ncbi:MAG: CARDB domain-containing protein [Parcubacteria group bacterium]
MTFAVIGAIVFFVAGVYGFTQLINKTGLKSELSQFVAFITSITIKKEVIEPKPELSVNAAPMTVKVSEFPKAEAMTTRKNPVSVLTPGQEMAKIYPVSNNTIAGKTGVDLSVSIIDVGIVTEPANTFTHADTTMASNERSGIVFEVTNIGNTASGMWYFHASLPVPGGDYNSDRQDSIPAGGKVRYTIGFQGLISQGENKAIITIDPSNQIPDANRANNTATATLYRGY